MLFRSISRNGAIYLPKPDTDTSAGNTTGFIKANRLVSHIEYPGSFTGAENFHGSAQGDNTFQPYEYYEVNPAYTSIMNDIKLASRGGARLSDILSDYVIKGVYVADNTYNAGYSDKT